MDSAGRPPPPPPDDLPNDSQETPLSPVVHKMTLSETLSRPPPPPPSAPVSNRTVWEEMGMPAPSPPAFVNRSIRDDHPAAAKLEAPPAAGVDRRSRVVLGILRRSKREAVLKKAEIGLRICALIFCLVSFSVMAADKTQGWAGDSFYRYKAYRYCLGVTVIGFVYSGFQIYQFVHNIVFGKYIIPYPFRQPFDFCTDQILAYLLMSASSSAATRTDDWVSNWGEDDFTKMATGSIGMSFMAFVSLALSSLISGFYLFSRGP